MQRYFTKEKIGNDFILSAEDLYHIKTVMRMKENDKIEVVYNNELYICKLNNGYGTILEKVDSKSYLSNVTLIIPLLTETKMDLILQKSTEL